MSLTGVKGCEFVAEDVVIRHAVVGPVTRCKRDGLFQKDPLGVVVSGNGDVEGQQVTDVEVALGLQPKPLAALGSGQPAVHPSVKAVERNLGRDPVVGDQPDERASLGLACSGE